MSLIRVFCISIAWGVFLLFFFLLISSFSFISFSRTFSILLSSRVLFSIKLSLVTAFVATVMSLMIGIPAAYALSRYEFFGKGLIDHVLEIPFIVTPVALGALLLIFYNTTAGEILQKVGFNYVFEIPGIILAQFITTVGLVTRMIKNTFDSISPRYEAVACTLGATPLQAFLKVTLPMGKPGILAATVLTFAKCIGEFGATITVAGSMPFKTETLPIAIFMRLSSADIEGMSVIINILVFVSLISLALIKAILREHHDRIT